MLTASSMVLFCSARSEASPSSFLSSVNSSKQHLRECQADAAAGCANVLRTVCDSLIALITSVTCTFKSYT
jgi:hypothetical protein